MILLLDTSTPTCRVSLIDGDQRYDSEWVADRQLAHGLLAFLNEQLTAHDWTWADLDGLCVYRGPGSFTGLRIGLTVLNTLADSLAIPIIGSTGDDWQNKALAALEEGNNDRIVLPLYDRDANITTPRK